jgi:hypothetical protein
MQDGKSSSATNRRVAQRQTELHGQGMESVALRGQGMTVVPSSVIESKLPTNAQHREMHTFIYR